MSEPNSIPHPAFPDIGSEPEPAPTQEQPDFIPGYKTAEDVSRALREGAEREARLASLVERVVTASNAAPQPAMPAIRPVPELPDPVEDKTRFVTALGEHIDKAVDARVSAAAETANSEAAYADAWRDFQAQYPEIAKHADIVNAATVKVAAQLRTGKIDPARYISTNRADFFASVNREATRMIDSVRGTTTAPPPLRTGGTSGGSQQAGTNTPATPRTSKANSPFVNEIKDLRQKLRMY